ncbi:MAG TPA: phosphohistidine phosphatase SixA [Gallionellaceae bacterium]|nr:phosphohistidine phosphatase SixA [Gallionellaceae bacterium]
MELILWRHAEAEDGVPDMKRRLTAKGEKQAEKMAAFLRARLPQNTRILVSPSVRTQQTARALTKHFETEPNVGPGIDPQSVLKAVGWPDGEGSVLVVGHQPYLGEIVALLMADADTSFSVKKGAAWWLSRQDHETILRLAIAPDLL